ncbi:MAG: LCP family protein, partial [Clostridia bacterium]
MKKFLCLLLCAALALTLSVPSLAQGEARDEDHFTLLLLGTDKAGLTKEEAKTKGRADAVVIVSLDLKWGDVRMASLERDLRVQIPETFQGETLIAGANKLCTSSFFAGPPLTRQLINETLRLDIGYYAAVDIGGMGKIVDALGGVEVEIGEEDLDMRVDGRKVFSSTGIKAMRGKMA